MSQRKPRFRKMESLVDQIDNFSWSLSPQKYYDVIKEIIELFEDGGKDEIVSKAEEDLKVGEDTKLTIAVTGQTGAGKTSFINSLRGLMSGDEGVGVTETTKKPAKYSHPDFPNVIFWDLPGIDSPGFPPKTYLEQVNFSRYDFFIIVCSKRFHSSDAHLAQEIQAMGKKFYFIRSRVDEDLRNVERANPGKYNEERVLKEIRDDCKQNLEKCSKKDSSPQIFLTSCWDLKKYDFPLLQETLEKDLDGLKRLAFVLSLPNSSPEVIQKKKDELKKQLWKISLVSAFINAAPIAFLPVCCDTVIMLKTTTGYYKQFGLDDHSLARLARWMKKPVAELKAVIQSPPEEDMNINVLVKLFSPVGGIILNHAFHIQRCVVRGVVSGVASGVISFVVTYWMLSRFLDKVAEDSERVLMEALRQVEAGADGQ